MSVYKVSGIGEDLEVFEDKVTITPRGVLGFLSKGLKGTKTIPFASITGIQHKQAGLTSGYLQFTLPGGNESRGGVFSAASDENTFMFKTMEDAIVEEIKVFIEHKIQEARSPKPASGSNVSAADELLKLAKLKEQGILSEEEFSKAKQKILGDT